MKYYDDVKKFHDKFGLVTPSNFFLIPKDLHEFRVKFFKEEFTEYVESAETQDLPNAIDALIDLVYITCGAALLHGLTIFEPEPKQEQSELFSESVVSPPKLLDLEAHNELVFKLRMDIKRYQIFYEKNSEPGIQVSLSTLYQHCLDAAAAMGFNQPRWDMLWDDVQRANMTKERAVRADQSKRGSTYDVFKPTGWVGPQTQAIVEMMVQGKA